MTRAQFLDTLRRRLSGLPPAEIDELISDYAAYFADGVAAGRSEAEIAAALGDPMRLARELRAEAGFRRWESARTPANFFAVLFGFLALMAVDFVFLLPLLGGLALFAIIAGFVLLGLCLAGMVMLARIFSWDHGFAGHFLSRTFGGIGLLGFGIGGGALLLLMIDYVVRLLGKFARLHYALLNRAEMGDAHG
jgi:uncharacterized membrane protein